MKTNQKMTIVLPGNIIVNGNHKTETIDLSNLWHQTQLFAGKTNASLQKWLLTKKTQAFLSETSIATGIPIEKLVQVKGKGGAARTWAHINVCLSAMSYLSPKVEAYIINEFVKGHLFKWRDAGGDGYIELNATLALKAEDVLGKPAHKGHYITIAKTLKTRLEVIDWNHATWKQQQKRTQLEDRLATMLKTGVVRDWDHLKELAEIV